MKRRRIGLALELVWPYRRHLDVFAGIQKYGREAPGWEFEIDEFIHERLKGGRGRRRPFDGLIARTGTELAGAARRARVPLVNVWFNSPVREEVPGVFGDMAAIGRTAGEHLVDRGFRQFACLGVPSQAGHRRVAEAFHGVFRHLKGARCICARIPMVYHETSRAWSRFQATLGRWIDSWNPPVGVLVTLPDVTVRYLVSAVLRRGLRVPEDVAVVATSNEPHVNLMPPPSISSVELNYQQIGYRAAAMLDLLMKGRRPPGPHDIVQPSGIIARDSTDYFAVEDPDVARAMRFIERNLSRKIKVNDVAAAVGTRRTLERRFRNLCGRSIAAEIRRLRILRVKRLLSETEMLIKQVAQESGFGDPIRLHEAFVRDVGVSPSEYRRKATSAS